MSSSNSGGGIGFCGLLTIIFTTLKILDLIDWSWWWVFSPIWIPTSVALLVLAIIVIIEGVLDR